MFEFSDVSFVVAIYYSLLLFLTGDYQTSNYSLGLISYSLFMCNLAVISSTIQIFTFNVKNTVKQAHNVVETNLKMHAKDVLEAKMQEINFKVIEGIDEDDQLFDAERLVRL